MDDGHDGSQGMALAVGLELLLGAEQAGLGSGGITEETEGPAPGFADDAAEVTVYSRALPQRFVCCEGSSLQRIGGELGFG
ncbi:hypothetical protein [Arthrobacter sp. SX1312]|uniref:hypothetical protein n=1 Tax=Arthrobacter sp. SX1312 TaxID=2058896 RepID=UPI0027D2AD1C|nr:hypothetical protein [Arthrobacter sp. SX1312]